MNKKKLKTIGLLVARMTSTRLPGKALRPVLGKPLLTYCAEAFNGVPGIDELWLATTDDPTDQPLLDWAREMGIKVFAYNGHINDVSGRLLAAAQAAQADRFLMVLGDSPYSDSRILTRLMHAWLEHPEWEGINIDRRDGKSAYEGIGGYTTDALERMIITGSDNPMYQEHVGYILNEQPDLVRMGLVKDDPEFYRDDYRLTVDTLSDFNLFNTVVTALSEVSIPFTMASTLDYLDANPLMGQINRSVQQKHVSQTIPVIVIAFQGGGTIGMGHCQRSLTMARAAQDQFGAKVQLWIETEDPSLRRDLAARGFYVIDEGTPTLAQWLAQHTVDMVLVDYKTDLERDWVDTAKTASRQGDPNSTFVILDNKGPGLALADLAVFPGVHTDTKALLEQFHLESRQLINGPDTCLLGEGFLYGASPALPSLSKEQRVLVSLGGRDPNGITERIMHALHDMPGLAADIVIPPDTPMAYDMMAHAWPESWTLHHRVPSLKPLMAKATVAVTAFGITVYELAAMGVPALVVSHYPDEADEMNRLASYGTCHFLGWGPEVMQDDFKKALSEILADEDKRNAMSLAGRQLVDGQGAQGILNQLFLRSNLTASAGLVSS